VKCLFGKTESSRAARLILTQLIRRLYTPQAHAAQYISRACKANTTDLCSHIEIPLYCLEQCVLCGKLWMSLICQKTSGGSLFVTYFRVGCGNSSIHSKKTFKIFSRDVLKSTSRERCSRQHCSPITNDANWMPNFVLASRPKTDG
jgi:hypothetical protein